MKKTLLLSLVSLCIFTFITLSQPVQSRENADEFVYLPLIQKPENPYWRKTYTGQTTKDVASIKDGGFLVLGPDMSFGFTLAKLDANGNPLWEKTGSTYSMQPQVLIEADDGSIIIAGEAWIPTNHNDNLWVAKLSSTGHMIWQKGYAIDNHGGNAFTLTPTANGGVAVAGHTDNDSDTDYWILNLDQNGAVIWQKTFGGNKTDLATVIKTTPDNGFIIAGYTYSFSPLAYTWVIKLNSQGSLVWQKMLQSELSYDTIWGMAVTPDGSSYHIGKKSSASGDNAVDWWVFKLDANGSLIWSKIYGIEGSNDSRGYRIFATDNDNIYMSGSSYKDTWQYLLFNIDKNGNPRWHKAYTNSLSIENVNSQFIALAGSLNGSLVLAKSNLNGAIPGCVTATQPSITIEDITKRIQTTGASVNTPAYSVSETPYGVTNSTFPPAQLACEN